MTQNICDNAGFFAGYALLRRSIDEIAAHPEWKINHRRPSLLLVSAER